MQEFRFEDDDTPRLRMHKWLTLNVQKRFSVRDAVQRKISVYFWNNSSLTPRMNLVYGVCKSVWDEKYQNILCETTDKPTALLKKSSALSLVLMIVCLKRLSAMPTRIVSGVASFE